MNGIDLGALEHAPHAALMSEIASRCAADPRIQAIWVGGSLAAGQGDAYSDIDFRIAVEPGHVDEWTSPEWQHYLPIPACGGLLLRFGEHALLHHLVLTDGTIVDFYVQDTAQHNPEPNIVVLACRNTEFRAMLDGFVQPAAALVREVDTAVARQFLVDYWITTHKQMKALARNYDYTHFAGVYFERMALLRAWYMHLIGSDIDTRPTLHMVGILHKGLQGKLTAEQHMIMGMPTRTPEETVTVIEAIRDEMTRVGHALAERYQFAYPQELEDVVRRVWASEKARLMRR
jgi:hypothetical protein